MKLHVYTQEEFNALPMSYGHKECPTGDYSAIKSFSEACWFEDGCLFCENSHFGAFSLFGAGCKFGYQSHFGACCSFGEKCCFAAYCISEGGCQFGPGCHFGHCFNAGMMCRFAKSCVFESMCAFDPRCKFASCCVFASMCYFYPECEFDAGCICEFGEFTKVINAGGGFDRSGHPACFFLLKNGEIFVRRSLVAMPIDKWMLHIRDIYADDDRAIQAWSLLIPAIKSALKIKPGKVKVRRMNFGVSVHK